MGDVGYHPHIEFAGGHTMLGQSVRSCFQHAMREALVGHLAQQGLQIHWIRGGYMKTRIQNFAADLRTHGADHSRSQLRTPQNVKDHHGGCGFSVGAGDPDHHHFTRGMPMPGSC